MSLDLPAAIGRYQILSELGRGAMGRVFLARDPNVDREVALKVMAPLQVLGKGEAAALRDRFLLEAQVAGRLSHSGIVMVLDADTDPQTGSPYIAMEWVKGCSLEKLLEEEGKLAPRRAVDIAIAVARALAHAHSKGVFHRDVKPGNVLLSAGGRVKVSDFGIAKLATLSVTATGQVMGTPHFMAPEQLLGEPVDARSDLFSLGALLYRLVTGHLPFAADNLATLALKVVQSEPEPVRDHAPEIPAALAAAIGKALAKDPNDRFQSGDEMALALESVADELEAESPSETRARSWEGLAAADTQRLSAGAVAAATSTSRWPQPTSPSARLTFVIMATLLVLLVSVSPLWRGSDAPDELAAQANEVVDTAPLDTPLAAGAELGTLDIVYKNRLGAATLAVSVDGAAVQARSFRAPKNPIKRMSGAEIRLQVPVPAGERDIGISLTGKLLKRVEASGAIHGLFEADKGRLLRVRVHPLAEELELSWEG